MSQEIIENAFKGKEYTKEEFWHTSSHILAYAVKKLFPEAKLGIGPAIENGFYYEFDHSFKDEDLALLEEEMEKTISEKHDVEHIYLSKEEATQKLRDEPFKLELLNEILEKDPNTKISFYRIADFYDLCSGPHLKNIGGVKAFKLLKITGSYWKGKTENPQLSRIYGISFPDQKSLDVYLRWREDIKKYDHRVLGKQLDFFSLHEEAPGMPFILQNMFVAWKELEDWYYHLHIENGYQYVRTPQLLNANLWKKSGHLQHFREEMFFSEIDKILYGLKPMNCPAHNLIYKEKKHSYKELPLRIAEFGLVHRNELSGVLHGLVRVRELVQDDAHIYLMPSQIEEEIERILDLIEKIYKTFDLNAEIFLSTKPEKAMGSPEIWEKAENALKKALENKGKKYKVKKGEGAFYGPKIDFDVKDKFGRSWQLATIQLDFLGPERFDLKYVSEENKEERVVMIHRALLGSFERFFGFLLEHFEGNLPLWFSPYHLSIITVSDRNIPLAEELYGVLRENKFRVLFDDRNESVSYKIRDSQLKRVPYMVVIGDREKDLKSIPVRKRDGKIVNFSVDEFVEYLKEKINTKALEL